MTEATQQQQQQCLIYQYNQNVPELTKKGKEVL